MTEKLQNKHTAAVERKNLHPIDKQQQIRERLRERGCDIVITEHE